MQILLVKVSYPPAENCLKCFSLFLNEKEQVVFFPLLARCFGFVAHLLLYFNLSAPINPISTICSAPTWHLAAKEPDSFPWDSSELSGLSVTTGASPTAWSVLSMCNSMCQSFTSISSSRNKKMCLFSEDYWLRDFKTRLMLSGCFLMSYDRRLSAVSAAIRHKNKQKVKLVSWKCERSQTSVVCGFIAGFYHVHWESDV